jgi:hypothetical protein
MKLTKQQIKTANKLIGLLCKDGQLDAENVYPLFDTESDAEYVCTILEKEHIIIAHWYSGHKIAILVRNENTCDCIENKRLDKQFSSEKRTVLSSKLNIIVAVISIISAISGFGVGVLISHSPESIEYSTIKANLDACTIRESKLNHDVDSLKNENKRLSEKVQTK